MNSALPYPAYLSDERHQGSDPVSRDAVDRLLPGDSAVMNALRHRLRLIASSDMPVLLTGPTGSGKEMATRAIHAASQRAAGPYIAVNCAAIPAELIESELFGHEKGAFTGATDRRIGRFEAAAGGTLLLDEIGDMTGAAQLRLLRVLEEGSFERVGSQRAIRFTGRVVAATHCDLGEAAKAGRFRADLFYRLAVITAELPPLSKRQEDIPALIRALTQDMPQVAVLAHDAIAVLMAHDWPGNVRELRSVLVRAALFHPPGSGPVDASQMEQLINPMGGTATPAQTLQSANPRHGGVQDAGLRALLDAVERRRIEDALHAAGGVVAEAARATGLNRTTFLGRMQRHGISRGGSPIKPRPTLKVEAMMP